VDVGTVAKVQHADEGLVGGPVARATAGPALDNAHVVDVEGDGGVAYPFRDQDAEGDLDPEGLCGPDIEVGLEEGAFCKAHAEPCSDALRVLREPPRL
jgi:hypothetical protein